MLIPPPGFTMPMMGPSCTTHLLSCLEQASLDVVPHILSGSTSYICTQMQVEDLLEMISCLRVFRLPNFKGRGKLVLLFWWHINPYVTYKKLRLQGYFLARYHFYICEKFTHGPTEKDEVYLHCYISRLVRDEMASRFLKRVPKKQVECQGKLWGFLTLNILVLACHTPSHHALPCIQCLHGLHGRSNLHMGSEIWILGSWQSQHAADQRTGP